MPRVCSAVWSCIRPGRSVPPCSVRPRPSQTSVTLTVFIFFLPDTNARGPGRPVFRPADLDLAAVQEQPDRAGGGEGEHVRQGAQPRPARGGIGQLDRNLGILHPPVGACSLPFRAPPPGALLPARAPATPS